MELGIIAGLGALGWTLAAKGTETRRTTTIPPLLPPENEYPFDPSVETRVLLDADARNAQAHVSKTVAGQYTFENPEPRPFLTSDKTASIDTQRRLELFTGSEEIWRHKSERPPVFNPEDSRVTVGSGGTAQTSTLSYDPSGLIDRNVFGTKMNNVLPFEQVRVGPGVGVDPNVPSADGFHSQFRVLPVEALNNYRINQLPGRANSGAATVSLGGRRYDHFEQQRPSLVQHAPNLGPGKTHFTATAWKPRPDLKPTRAQGTLRSYVGAKYDVTKGTAARDSCHAVHVQKKRLPKIPLGPNNTSISAPMETHIKHTKNPTQRCNDGSFEVTGGTAASARALTARGEVCLKPTVRETPGGAGPATRIIASGTMRPCAPGDSGLRESKALNTGVSAFLKRASTEGSRFNLGRGHEAAGRCIAGALPGGVRGDRGRVQRKRMVNAFCKPPIGFAPHALQRTDPGLRTSKRKLSSYDPRVDTLGIGLFGCTGPHGDTHLKTTPPP